MACLSTARRARVQARITKLEDLLDSAYEAYALSLADGDVSKYRLDTHEGEQETALRSPDVLLKQINSIEATLSRLYRKLEGGGIVNMNLRRR